MIKRLLQLALLSLVLAGAGVLLFQGKLFHQSYTHDAAEEFENEDNERAEIAGALQYLNSLKADLKTGKVDPSAVYAVNDQLSNQPKYKMGDWLQWNEMGPDNVGGRCRAIVIDKDNQNTIYAGGVSGGVWQSTNGGSTWHRFGGREVENINITSLVQSADGSLYYGTGEMGFISSGVGGDGNSGFVGRGVFKLSAGASDFTQLNSTDPNVWNTGRDWSNVHHLAVDPTDANRVYAGCDGGLMISSDAGQTWKKANIAATTRICKDIAISNDGQTIYAVMASSNPGTIYQLWRSDDRGANFKRLGASTLSTSSCSYVVAISPSNNDIVYLSSASTTNYGALDAVYRSTDKGESWQVIGKGDNVFNPLGFQGWYDHCIAVDPKNPDRVILGGQYSIWTGKKVNDNFQWNQISTWAPEFLDNANTYRNPYFVHADQHLLLFDKKSTPSLWVGSDGGISKSTDITYTEKPTFYNADYGFNTVQFYGIGVSAYNKSEVVGGAQDNGVIRVDQGGLTLLNGTSIKGGDGGYCEISKINSNIYFSEYTNGNIYRSFNKGAGSNSWSTFFDDHVPAAGGPRYPFISIFTLWESLNDPSSIDSVSFVDLDNDHKAGETVLVRSKNGVDFEVKLTSNLPKGQTLNVQDKIQSKFIIGAYNGIYMTKDALAPGITPVWFQIADIPGLVPHDIKYSKDGNTVFVSGTEGVSGVVYRISGLSGKKFAYDASGKFYLDSIGVTKTKIFSMGGQVATGVAVDENDPNHILVTLGSYGYPSHVYRSYNALGATPTFDNIDNGLPDFPVYAGLISLQNKNNYLIGTEAGIWSSRDAGKTWKEENEGMERVPTFMIRQMKFEDKPWIGPVFYAATHGRGVFMSETLVSGIDPKDNAAVKTDLSIYPNPAMDFANVKLSMEKASDVQITIFDLQGKAVGTYNFQRQGIGEHTFQLQTAGLKRGTYLVRVKTADSDKTSKLLIME